MRRTALLAAALFAPVAAPANDFRGPIFASPLPGGPGATVPGGGPLVAPVITPSGTRHGGKQLFEMIPAGWDRDPFYTADPARYTTGACDDPIACTGGHCGGISFDFLLWATQGAVAPPLITTGPVAAGVGVAGAPGQPGTTTLLGGERVLTQMRPGFRFEGSLPLTGDGRWGISARFEMLGAASSALAVLADGTNVVTVPQAVTVAGVTAPLPVPVGFPGTTFGGTTASLQTNYLGGDVSLRRALWAGDAVRLDALVGYRVLHLGDRLESSFTTSANALAGLALLGAAPSLGGFDTIHTRNDFHGVLLGLGSSARFGRWWVGGRMAVSLGGTSSELDQFRARATNGVPLAAALAGLPALADQNAVTSRADEVNRFTVVPEASVKVGWRAADYVHLTAGYSFTYWNRVRRAPDQYDLSATPTGTFTDFWAQGLSLGLEWRY